MTTQMPRQPEPELMDIAEEAEAYARSDFADVNAAFVARLLEMVGSVKSASIVDLGCGPAEIPIRVAIARPGWQITAVEAAPAMLNIARQAVQDAGVGAAVRLVQADAKATRLPDASFDVVMSNSLLHHLPDPQPFWQDVRRIGRPGAVVLIRDLARPASPKDARQIVDQHAGTESAMLQEEFYRSLLSAFTPQEVMDQLEAAGLGALRVAMVSDRHLDIAGRLGD